MSCQLCPRFCQADRSIQKGFCGCTDQMRIARIGLHRYEEPCICGEGGSGGVFFSGCNLRCVFCQNKVLQSGTLGQLFSPDELASAMLELQGIGAENINLVTPTPHVEGICRAIALAKERGLRLPILYNTNGYLTVDTVDKLSEYVDIWLPDLKYHDQRLADRFSSAPHYFDTAIAAIGRMLSHAGQLALDDAGRAKKGVLIRHLVLPACVYDTRDILLAIAERFGTETYLSLMRQFTPQPDGKAPLNRRLTRREYDNAVDACLRLGFTRVYLQEAESASFAYTPAFSDRVTVQSRAFSST